MLDKFLIRLSQELSISPPQKGVDSLYTWRVAPSLEVKIADLSPGIGLSAQIMDCPLNKREDLFVYLMRANLLGQGTGGARIGLSRDEKSLTLSLGLPYEINQMILREKLEGFLNYVLHWREEIPRYMGLS